MKKVLIVYGLLVIVIIGIVFLRFRGINLLPNIGGGNATATIKEQEFKVEVADDDKERAKGLSDRNSLDKDRGMVFVFEKKGNYGFWMRNVKFPLDLIYISDNKITDIFKNAEPKSENDENIPIFTPENEANFVLEINGGLSDEYGFTVGDEVVFSGIN